jgi:hypothetical protein
MKHIYNDVRTRATLERWGGRRKLLTASHCFWYIGSEALNVAERGDRDPIGYLIELGHTPRVKPALTARKATKQGRPYLDYAIRYDANADFRSDYGPDEFLQDSGNCAMVQMLLDLGCNVNEPI